eukprot:11781054-Karenia_brevis.AAC.1
MAMHPCRTRFSAASEPAKTDPMSEVRWSDPEVENDGASEPPARNSSIIDGALREEPDEEGRVPGQGRMTPMKLQRALQLIGDNTRLRHLLQDRADACDHEGLRRLAELRHPATCHAWLWQISPQDGTILRDQDFSTALRHRLGARFLSDSVACRVCGSALDVHATHALCCASSQSTIGHYNVARTLADGLKVAD